MLAQAPKPLKPALLPKRKEKREKKGTKANTKATKTAKIIQVKARQRATTKATTTNLKAKTIKAGKRIKPAKKTRLGRFLRKHQKAAHLYRKKRETKQCFNTPKTVITTRPPRITSEIFGAS